MESQIILHGMTDMIVKNKNNIFMFMIWKTCTSIAAKNGNHSQTNYIPCVGRQNPFYILNFIPPSATISLKSFNSISSNSNIDQVTNLPAFKDFYLVIAPTDKSNFAIFWRWDLCFKKPYLHCITTTLPLTSINTALLYCDSKA